jgi:phenylacetate-CoA ligase
VIRRENNLDTLEVKVEIDEKNWSDSIRVLEGIRKRIEANIKSMLGITAIIKLVEPNSIQRSEGKAQRIIDLR